ncbi:hypothetical protein A0H81_14493 [Grifola frondosa]|uniref:Uncharacterized protein n=1 Tax=Grifola frondosa TaxID=5627 RepID=A0A1C7LN00_GRIFR|nr:hypothetical protein A0H81_14493 [Grifola frondosa]
MRTATTRSARVLSTGRVRADDRRAQPRSPLRNLQKISASAVPSPPVAPTSLLRARVSTVAMSLGCSSPCASLSVPCPHPHIHIRIRVLVLLNTTSESESDVRDARHRTPPPARRRLLAPPHANGPPQAPPKPDLAVRRAQVHAVPPAVRTRRALLAPVRAHAHIHDARARRVRPLPAPAAPKAHACRVLGGCGRGGEDEEARARLRLLDEFPTPPTVERFCESAGPPVVALATVPSCNDVFAALSNAGTSPPERRVATPMPVRPRRPSCGSLRLPCHLDRPMRPPPPPDLGLRDQLAQENRSRRRVGGSYHPALPPPPPNKRIESPLEPSHPFRARCMARDDWDAFLPAVYGRLRRAGVLERNASKIRQRMCTTDSQIPLPNYRSPPACPPLSIPLHASSTSYRAHRPTVPGTAPLPARALVRSTGDIARCRPSSYLFHEDPGAPCCYDYEEDDSARLNHVRIYAAEEEEKS